MKSLFQSALNWLRLALLGPSKRLWRLPTVQGWKARCYEPGDFDACMSIFRQNAPGRFPANAEEEFVNYLNSDKRNILVIELAGEVVATGGICSVTEDYHTLGFGLVAPAFQGRGFGTLLLCLRLAHLSDSVNQILVHISSVKASIGFYQRFGFQIGEGGSPDEPQAFLWVSTKFILDARQLLHTAGVEIPILRQLHFENPHGLRIEWEEAPEGSRAKIVFDNPPEESEQNSVSALNTQ